MRKFRIFLRIAFVLVLAIAIFTLWANLTIYKKSDGFTTTEIFQLKNQKVGLLLGTSRYLKNNQKNLYFFNRIEAAAQLYHSGKIDYIIASGDNSRVGYNEPQDMKEELIKLGVPAERIYLDYAGFRTLDSILRAKIIFGQNSFIVISQRFHNERAIYIARRHGIEAYGFNAEDVFVSRRKMQVRELLARNKVFWDILFHVKPKYYGEAVAVK